MFLITYLKWLNLSKLNPNLKKWRKVAFVRYQLYRHCSVQAQSTTKKLPPSNYTMDQLFMLCTMYRTQEVNTIDTRNFWYLLYQQYYFTKLFKATMLIKNINAIDVIPTSLLAYMINAVRSVKWKRYSIAHSNEIIEILFISLWLKNLKLFMGWMRKYFESAHLKKHRKLFLLLNMLLGRIVWNYNLFLQLKGLRVVLLGKFGKAGSVRKTRKYIRRGKCSYTTKKIALINQTNVIRTATGVFSIKLEVFY